MGYQCQALFANPDCIHKVQCKLTAHWLLIVKDQEFFICDCHLPAKKIINEQHMIVKELADA